MPSPVATGLPSGPVSLTPVNLILTPSVKVRSSSVGEMVTVLAPAGTDDFGWAWAKAGAESARARTIASPAVRTGLDMRLLPTATAHAWAPNTTEAARVRRL